MKKVYYSLIFSVIFIVSNQIWTFAFYEKWNMDERVINDRQCSMRDYTYFFNEILTPKVNNIRFRQDDGYYYFDYDIDYISNDIKRNSYVDTTPGSDNIFVTQFKDTWPSFSHNWLAEYNGNYNNTNFQRTNGEITYGTHKFTYHLEKHQQYNSSYNITREYFYTYNVSSPITIPISGLKNDHYYNTPDCLHGYYYERKAQKVNGLKMGTANVTSNATSLSDDYWQYNYKGTIKIAKGEFLTYRYLTFLATDAMKNMREEENKNYVYNGYWEKYDLRGYSIDLDMYRMCDHDWELVNMGDKNNHELVCTKCNWIKKEPHILVNEYDGIPNNECMCGYHNTINLTINVMDENNDVIAKRVPSFEKIATISTPSKIGNSFLYYNLYEKHKIGISTYSEILIGTRSEIDEYSANYSMRYDPVYKPIKYTFHYSSENKYGMYLKEHIDDQIFFYGSGQILKYSEYVKGKCFIGWSLSKDKGIPDFNAGQYVNNYTDVDNSEFTLYPIYDDMYYYIRYITSDGVYENGSNTYLVKYFYTEDKQFELPHPNDKSFNVSHYTYNGNKVSKLSEIKDLAVYKDTVFNLYANLVYSSGSSGGSGGSGGGASDTSSSYGPSGNSGNSGTLSGNSPISGNGPGENIAIAENPDNNVNYDIVLTNDNLFNNDQKLEKINISDANIDKSKNLLYKEEISEEPSAETKYSENYENLMNYLRAKYENEKKVKEQENTHNDNNGNFYIESSEKKQGIINVAKKYGGIFLSAMAVILSALWTFIPGKL